MPRDASVASQDSSQEMELQRAGTPECAQEISWQDPWKEARQSMERGPRGKMVNPRLPEAHFTLHPLGRGPLGFTLTRAGKRGRKQGNSSQETDIGKNTWQTS